MTDISPKTTLVSLKGGTIDVLGDGGEVLLAIPVPVGRSFYSQYLDLIPDGYRVDFSGLVLVPPPSGVGIQDYGKGSHDTGANPDYKPSSADRMQREMRMQLDRLKANNDATERRMAALDQIERIPRRDPGLVIEETAPAPAPAADTNVAAQ